MNPGGIMNSNNRSMHVIRGIMIVFIANIIIASSVINQSHAQSLDLAIDNKGVSFGNSKKFTGLRINLSDREVEKINGVNLTVWKAKNNKEAVVNGVSIGLFGPEAGYLNGIHLGGIGVGAEKELKGISFGILGAGSGGSISGFTFGGLGAGAGGDITGVTIGGLGAGAGGNIKGLTFALMGAGAGGDITGITFGGFGAGAGGKYGD